MATSIATMENPSVVLYGPGNVKIEDRPVEELGPRDVLVRIAFIGTCGSDVHFWKHGGITNKVDPQRGIVMGHEASGIIHSIGSEVTSISIGDHVAIEPGVPCRYCKACKNGTYNLCRKMRFAAAPATAGAPDTPGTLSKFWKIPEDFVHRLPDSISLEEAVLVEPLSVAIHATKLADIRPGETVVIMGSGTVGLLCAAAARNFGAQRIALVDVLEKKLVFAKGWLPGCEVFKVDTNATSEANAKALLGQLRLKDEGVDAVIEASGAASSIATGIHILRLGGKFVQTGLGQPKVEFPIVALSEKELMVRGCFRYASGDFELAVHLLQDEKVNVKSFISSFVDFEDTPQAWERTAIGEGIKNLIRGVQD
ncbi:GroES-like protein [Aaosphaeria arxii CBS 175.79]|uniref:D-xylulose reductase n=1 Tax=Aaosphaeria arxii CBS 175.79 TaxID=1450172 RepID=A0A6A5XYD3_9PLEO|nr:GroES-like protein [Aaosphaeria arxii CBS 175.79]KAF2017933.1 GroES-like protein [Aaosphaeria arxii CBS 175.79]